LNFVDEDSNLLELSIANGGLWLKYFSHSNSLYTKAIRVIINYTPIEKYRLRFFLKKDIMCLCGEYFIEIRCYILHKYKKYNDY